MVRSIVNHKVFVITQDIRVHAKDAEACGVEGCNPHVVSFIACAKLVEYRLYAVAHLARRLVGEGHRQDVPWAYAFFVYEISYAACHHAGLAGACARKH